MAAQTHYVQLTARDGVSTVFQTIARSSRASATQVTQDWRGTAAGLQQTEAAAVRTSIAMQRLSGVAGGAVGALSGAGVATAVGALSELARAAAEEEAGLQRLEQAVENTGASYGRYADQIDAAVQSSLALSFADDEAVNALNTLTAATGDAERALNLLGTAQDLARGKGISLASASEIVGKVAQGNLGILSRYGIVLEEGATSTEALAAIQQRFAGQAETYANSQIGAATRVKNAIADMGETVGASTGDLQGLLLILPGLSQGFTLLGGVIGTATTAMAGGRVAALALTASLGPLALLLAGGAALGVLAVKINEAANESENAQDSVDNLTSSLAAMAETADRATLSLLTNQLIPGLEETVRLGQEAEQTFANLTEQLNNAPQIGLGISPEIAQNADEATRALQEQHDAAERMMLIEAERTRLRNDMAAIIQQGYQEEIRAANETVQAFNDGEISAGDLLRKIDDLAGATNNYALAGGEAVTATDALAVSAYAAAAAANTQAEAIRLTVERYRAQTDAANEAERSARAAAGIAANQGAGGVVSFPTRADSRTAEGTRIFNDDRERQAQADEDRARALDELTRAEDRAADSAQSLADARAEGARRAADMEADYAAAVRDSERSLASELRSAEQSRIDAARSVARERASVERETAQELRGIDQQRADYAAQVEEQLSDLAARRGEVAANAAAQAADAERQWLDASAENLERQAELRDALRDDAAEAARAWQELVRENNQAEAELEAELRGTIQAAQADWTAMHRDIQGQIAEVRESLRESLREQQIGTKRSLQDNAREAQRIRDDLAYNLADPNLDAEERARLELEAQRRLQDLAIERRRTQQDARREEKQAREDAKKQEDDLIARERDARLAMEQTIREARAQTAEQIAALHEQERKQLADMQREQAQQRGEAAEQIAALEADRLEAQEAYRQRLAEIGQEEVKQLAEIAAQEAKVRSEQAARFAELEQAKRVAVRDSAREQETLAREAAQAEQRYGRETANARTVQTREATALARGYEEERQRLAQETNRRVTDLMADEQSSVAELQAAIESGAALGIDTRAFDDGIAAAQEEAGQLVGAPLTVDIDADVQEWSRKVVEAGGVLATAEKLDELTPTVTVRADMTPFWATVRAITERPSVGDTAIRVEALQAGAARTPTTQSVGMQSASMQRAGSFGGTAAPVYNYGTINVYPASADLASEISRQLATANRI